MKAKSPLEHKLGFASIILRTLLASLIALSMLGLAACSSTESSSSEASADDAEETAFVEPNAERSIPDPEAPQITVSVVVDPGAAVEAGSAVKGFEEALTFPDIIVYEGDTALDALFDTGVVVTTSGSYVTDINGLAAGAAGDESGWMYSVNDEVQMVAATDYRLAGGDVIRWYYVTSYEG